MNIPKGYKLLPVEPTCSMVLAGLKALGGCVGSCGEASPPDGGDINDAFSAMLAAAPAPPQPLYDEAKEQELFAEWWRNTPILRASKLQLAEEAWLARAQSRAKAVEISTDDSPSQSKFTDCDATHNNDPIKGYEFKPEPQSNFETVTLDNGGSVSFPAGTASVTQHDNGGVTVCFRGKCSECAKAGEAGHE